MIYKNFLRYNGLIFRQRFALYTTKASNISKKSGSIGIKVGTAIGLLGGGIVGFYTLDRLLLKKIQDKTSNQDIILDRYKFSKYYISYKEDIDDKHFLLEIKPKKRVLNCNIWEQIGPKKLWSIEVKQPEIMITRNYTPLPLFYNSGEDKLELISQDEKHQYEGNLLFYIKKYDTGEVSRWLYGMPIGHQLEIRGPIIDCDLEEFSKMKNEENKETLEGYAIQFITAGTGVAPALQLLLRSLNKNRNLIINVINTCQNVKELGVLYGWIEKCSNTSAINCQLIESSKNDNNLKQNLTLLQKSLKSKTNFLVNNKTKEIDTIPLSLVCGPEGFLTAVAGNKIGNTQGPVTGILADLKWTEKDVYKMN